MHSFSKVRPKRKLLSINLGHYHTAVLAMFLNLMCDSMDLHVPRSALTKACATHRSQHIGNGGILAAGLLSLVQSNFKTGLHL